MESKDYKIEVYIPKEFGIQLRNALNEAGILQIGNYDHCCSMVAVNGYWRPLESANPYQGVVGEVCRGDEVKVEFRCNKDDIQTMIKVVKAVHPYEEPVYDIIPLANREFE